MDAPIFFSFNWFYYFLELFWERKFTSKLLVLFQLYRIHWNNFFKMPVLPHLLKKMLWMIRTIRYHMRENIFLKNKVFFPFQCMYIFNLLPIFIKWNIHCIYYLVNIIKKFIYKPWIYVFYVSIWVIFHIFPNYLLIKLLLYNWFICEVFIFILIWKLDVL